ncbi:caspase family protein, partial [Rhizorhabdus wittichii]
MSIHIGLNNLDVSSYGEQTVLAGCINDADSMQSLAAGQGFQTRRMVDEEATADAVIEAISDAANTLRSGDMLFLTYSGHGSQVSDVDGDEADGLDETWCLYDRMLIDDELSQLWSRFEAG